MRSRKKRKSKIIPAFICILVFILIAYFGTVSVLKTLYPLKYADYVETYTEEYGLEKSFVFSVIECESGFDKDAVSNVGARGLMQIMPETFDWLLSKTGEDFSEDDLFEPEVSIKYGCMLYSRLLSQFNDEKVAVAAYHAGTGNVQKWLKNPEYSEDGKTLIKIPFSSTDYYAQKVIKVKAIYEKLYDL